MSEQTINYGEARFKDIKPKEVLAGVKDAAFSWWNEFSPGTVGKEHVEAFDRVASRIKNEDLRKFFRDKKELVRWAGMVRGTGTLVIDATLATVPWYLKFKNRFAGEAEYRARQVSPQNNSAVIDSRAYAHEHSQAGKDEAKIYENARAFHPFSTLFWKDFLIGSHEYRARQEYIKKNVKIWAQNQAIGELSETDPQSPSGRVLNAEGIQIRDDIVKKRVSGRRRLTNIKLGGLAGVEAGVFAFRPATRLAKFQTRVGEKVASLVVDHIVNNIVKGPSGEPAKMGATPAS